MKINSLIKRALVGAVLLCGATCAAADAEPTDDSVVACETSASVALDNLATHTAVADVLLALPAAWGDASGYSLTVAGDSASGSGESYTWQTGPLMPGNYTVSLTQGDTTQTANFVVEALDVAEWGTLDIDNTTTHIAKTTEPMALPAAWGETVEKLQLVVKGGLEDVKTDLSENATSYSWGTLPLMPGTYTAQLTWDGGSSETVTYTVASADEDVTATAAFIDNQLDSKSETGLEENDVRDMAEGHTNLLQIVSLGTTEDPEITFEGETLALTVDENGGWLWSTNGLSGGVYTFTKTVGNTTETAKFRLTGEQLVAVLLGGKALPVDKTWYESNIAPLNGTESAKAISDALKVTASNGTPFWKNYVMGWDPSDANAALLVQVTSVDVKNGKLNAKVVGRTSTQTKFGTWVPRYRLLSSENAKSGFEQAAEPQSSPEFKGLPFELPAQRYYRAVIFFEQEQ